MSDSKPFEGRVALVTGASRGIGAAIAKALAAKGAHVILTARDDAALERVEDEIHQGGGSATIAPVDLGQGDGVARLAQAIASRWDALDMLVIGAAYLPTLTPVTQIDPKQFNTAITTNILATQALLAGLHPLLKRADAARVIGLTSSVGDKPRAYWAAYGSTKAAFDNLNAMRRKSPIPAQSVSRLSTPAPRAPPCGPKPIPAKTPKASSRPKRSDPILPN